MRTSYTPRVAGLSDSDDGGWRTRTLVRSTITARDEGAERRQRLLDSARSTILENGSIELTVHGVVERSGLSREAAAEGLLRPGAPRRPAAIVLQAATTTAGRSAGSRHPIAAEEMWETCLHAIATDDVVAARRAAPCPSSDTGR